MPGSDWDLTSREHDGTTTVRISIYNESLERLERMIAGGFSEGMMMMLNHLEELLAQGVVASETKR